MRIKCNVIKFVYKYVSVMYNTRVRFVKITINFSWKFLIILLYKQFYI